MFATTLISRSMACHSKRFSGTREFTSWLCHTRWKTHWIPDTGTLFHNYKESLSLVLMAVCDVNFFTMIDIGQYWSNNDSGVLSRKEMGKRWNLQVKCISLKPIVPQAFQFDLFIFFTTRFSYWKTNSCICILTKCYKKTNPFTIIETLVQDVVLKILLTF